MLTEKFTDLIATLTVHIRLFRDYPADVNNSLDLGVLGFWNLMLEVIFILFVIACFCAGVLLTAALAIVSYPLKALLNVGSVILSSIKNPHNDIVQDRIQPRLAESPVIRKLDKKANGKEKE